MTSSQCRDLDLGPKLTQSKPRQPPIAPIPLKPDKPPPAPHARQRRRPAAHAVIHHQLARPRVTPDKVFKESHRLLRRTHLLAIAPEVNHAHRIPREPLHPRFVRRAPVRRPRPGAMLAKARPQSLRIIRRQDSTGNLHRAAKRYIGEFVPGIRFQRRVKAAASERISTSGAAWVHFNLRLSIATLLPIVRQESASMISQKKSGAVHVATPPTSN